MRAFGFSCSALSIGVLGALLSACGGASSVPIGTANTFVEPAALKHHQTFSYTGKEQTFTVPAGVTRLTVVARGGQGPGEDTYNDPGFPGRVYAVIRVHSGKKLYVFVAGSGLHGGFNGGGASGHGDIYFGGGASDVRMGGDTLKDRVIVAAGGGTAGSGNFYCFCNGGNGGGLNGQSGSGFSSLSGKGGRGGTQSAGGAGGSGGGSGSKSGQPGSDGALGVGGSGGNGNAFTGSGYYYGFPGGGGGGYYGGGGGGGGGASSNYSDPSVASGGGGGGSSYVEPSAITSRMWTGWHLGRSADGLVVFSWN